MRPATILIPTGMKHGHLTVVGEDGKNSYGCRMFKCVCDCGAEVRLRATHFYPTRLHCSRSCPLLSARRVTDLSGKKFGRWTVKSYAKADNRGDALWECVCDCGTERLVRGFQLTGGDTKSCGCSLEARIIYHTPEEKLAGRRRASRICAAKNPARMKAGKIKYESKLSKATPSWLTDSDWAEMNAIYRRARSLTKQTGVKHQVDHVIPLNGKMVSGLHVPANLQILTQAANVSKSNRYAEHLGD